MRYRGRESGRGREMEIVGQWEREKEERERDVHRRGFSLCYYILN